jgi:hypothetical protein
MNDRILSYLNLREIPKAVQILPAEEAPVAYLLCGADDHILSITRLQSFFVI